jgi:PIN domain-containing protein
MIRPARPAIIRYYVDADVLGLGKILTETRADTTYPGHPGGPVKGGRIRPACTVTDVRTDDEVWIAETARNGWLIITRDGAIQDNRREIEAVRANGARMIALAGADATDTFHQLET